MHTERHWRRTLGAIMAILLATPLHAQVSSAESQSRIVLTPFATLPGRDADSEPAQFGTISRAVLRSAGSVVLADNQAHALSLVDLKGTRVASGSLSGDSRQGVVHVSAIAIDAKGDLLIYDERSGFLHSYQVRGSSIRLAHSAQLFSGGSDMCVMHQSAYVLLYHNGNVIHEFDLSGRHVRSFAPPDGENDVARMGSLAGGAGILCDAATGTVMLRVSASPVLRAFNSDGTSRWRQVVPDFRSLKIEAMSDGSIEMSRPPGGVDVTMSAFALAGGALAVQIARNRPDTAQHRKPPIETIVLRAKDGVQLASSSRLEKLFELGQHKVGFVERSPRQVLRIWSVSMAP